MTNKELTERQAEVLDLLNSGKTPKQVAAHLGITDTSVYATRRKLIAAGHLPAKTRRTSARKQRGLSARGAATVARAANGGNGTAPTLASVVGSDNDPVTVISRRVLVVNDEIETHMTRVVESTAALDSLSDESQRLAKALKVLAPPSPNGSRKNTSARKRRRVPA